MVVLSPIIVVGGHMPIIKIPIKDNASYDEISTILSQYENAFNKAGYMCVSQTTAERIFASKKFMFNQQMWERFSHYEYGRTLNFSVADPNNIFGQIKNLAAEKLRIASNKYDFLILEYDGAVSTQPTFNFDLKTAEKELMISVRSKITPRSFGKNGDLIMDLKDCPESEFWSKICSAKD